MEDTATAVHFTKQGAIAHLTLHRPHVLNAYDTTMRDALFEALLAIRDDPEVRVVLLDAAGAAFCSGGDLNEFGTAPPPLPARRIRQQRDVWETLRTLAKPIVAAIQGACVGSGLELALACDIRVVSDDARFAYPETGRGLIPGAGGTQTTSRHVGMAQALEWILTGRELDAAAALRCGLASRVVARLELAAGATAIAQRLAQLPLPLLVACKRSVCDGLELPLARGLALEKHWAQQLGSASPDGAAGFVG